VQQALGRYRFMDLSTRRTTESAAMSETIQPPIERLFHGAEEVASVIHQLKSVEGRPICDEGRSVFDFQVSHSKS
jgi:hypothetical protein